MMNSYEKDTIVTELISKAKGNSTNPFSFGTIDEMPASGEFICKVRMDNDFIVNALMLWSARVKADSGSRVAMFNSAGTYCVMDVLYKGQSI
ncbi:hypothetical protein [Bacillus thuringiensis]|uniref:hypothetical protein n=1 Tax=Bacillus thuringiensis TaxID=1428 RepID=UPI00159C5F01|nr:hypothetical protein [Bacillus thuringiensis]